MTALLEIRDTIKKIYARYAAFIIPVIKFLLAFIVLDMINGKMGYMTKLDNLAIVMVIGLFCSFMPTGTIVLFAAIFSMLHMYALSMEVALVGFCAYLILALLFFRFNPKDSLAVVITPMLFFMKMPYVVPIAIGLVGSPFSAISVACGIVVYYLLTVVTGSAPTINTMGDEPSAKIRLIIDGVLDNKAMLVLIAAFAITVIAVYFLRRMSVEHCWTIAMVAGVIINLVVLLIGDLMYDTHLSVAEAVIGSVVAILVGKVIEFFRFCVDFSRAEKVQFEDDEYYYYVKAVPKMIVAEPTKTVKKINAQQRPAGNGHGGAGAQRPAQQRRERSVSQGQRPVRTGQTTHSAPQTQHPAQRSVTTERTVRTDRYGDRPRQGMYQNNRRDAAPSNARSVTINSRSMPEEREMDDMDDFEELF